MPYATGTVNSLSDLRTALASFVVTNGWTAAGNVFYKDGCYVDVTLVAAGSTDKGALMIRGGLGIDGSNNLTNDGGAAGYLGPLMNVVGIATDDWDWPATYHLFAHADPDEVYLFVNYGGGQFWQNLAFGRSPAPGCPGTGNWYHGFSPAGPSSPVSRPPPVGSNRWRQKDKIVANPDGSRLSSWDGGMVGCAPFWWEYKDESNNNMLSAQFHGVYDHTGAVGWSNLRYVMGNSATNPLNTISSSKAAQPLPTYSPNAWNNEAHLIRWQVLQHRPEIKSSIVGELKHLRFVRNDFLADGELITLGPDRWKVFPFYRKNAAARNGAGVTGGDHSGTQAMAVRYDGP